MISFKARYTNEKQVCNSFKNFRGQNPANSEAVCRWLGCLADCANCRCEPKYCEQVFGCISRTIAHFCEAESPVKWVVEVDESYFGARRVRGLRGRGARGKTIVFGLFKRNGRVYTEVVPDYSKATLQGIIRGRVELESIIHSDGWRGYDGLVDLGYQKHFRVQHGNNEFANKHSHINGIESFWAFAKTRLVRFRGLAKHTFYFHLKECEFRFNHRNEDIYKLVL